MLPLTRVKLKPLSPAGTRPCVAVVLQGRVLDFPVLRWSPRLALASSRRPTARGPRRGRHTLENRPKLKLPSAIYQQQQQPACTMNSLPVRLCLSLCLRVCVRVCLSLPCVRRCPPLDLFSRQRQLRSPVLSRSPCRQQGLIFQDLMM